MKYPDELSTKQFEYSYKCGACAHKFSAGMTLSVGGKLHCPRCKELILSFPSDEDVRKNDYIAHTRNDRFHSIIAPGGDES